VRPESETPDRVTAVVGEMAQVIPEEAAVCTTEKEPPPTNVCGPGFKKAGACKVFVIVNVIGVDATPFGL